MVESFELIVNFLLAILADDKDLPVQIVNFLHLIDALLYFGNIYGRSDIYFGERLVNTYRKGSFHSTQYLCLISENGHLNHFEILTEFFLKLFLKDLIR